MAHLPHDVTDLQMASVALAVDERIEEFSELDPEALAYRIAEEGDHHDFTPELRADGLLQALALTTEMHGWEMTYDRRGIRLTHGERTIVLGVPPTVVAYVHGVESTV